MRHCKEYGRSEFLNQEILFCKMQLFSGYPMSIKHALNIDKICIKCHISDMISLCRSRLFSTVAQHSRSACLSSTPGSVDFGRIRASSNPQLPLCERSAVYVESAAIVSKWYREVSHNLVKAGDELQKDGGPMYDDLVTELGWLMEDAVVGWKEFAASEEPNMACADGSSSSSKSREDAMLKLRISIVELRTCVCDYGRSSNPIMAKMSYFYR